MHCFSMFHRMCTYMFILMVVGGSMDRAEVFSFFLFRKPNSFVYQIDCSSILEFPVALNSPAQRDANDVTFTSQPTQQQQRRRRRRHRMQIEFI